MTRLNESLLLESSRLSTDIRHMPRQSALNLLPIDQSLQRSQEALNSLEALTAGHLVLVARMRGVRVAKCLCSMAIRLDRLVFNDSLRCRAAWSSSTARSKLWRGAGSATCSW